MLRAVRGSLVSDLEGKVAIVTGGGSGVGSAIGLALAAAKASVCLIGRTRRHLESVANEVHCRGSIAYVYPTDIANDAELDALVRTLEREHGRADILVQNAAIHHSASVEKAALADLDLHYRTNLRAPYALTQELLPMLKAQRGQVVFINSSSGVSAKPMTSQYDATKHALRAFADSLRGEVNAAGIRVTSVYLGRTASEMQRNIHQAGKMPYQPERMLQPEDIASVVLNCLMLPPTAEVTDIHIRPMIPNAAPIRHEKSRLQLELR
jgi:NADP-dependent 3-hydroxy acid dehydrogenase YdfG